MSPNTASPPVPSMMRCSEQRASPSLLAGKPQRLVLKAELQLLPTWHEQSFAPKAASVPDAHHAIDPDVSTITKK
jgi:hypothetical protein